VFNKSDCGLRLANSFSIKADAAAITSGLTDAKGSHVFSVLEEAIFAFTAFSDAEVTVATEDDKFITILRIGIK
jgi:hypothetical protein